MVRRSAETFHAVDVEGPRIAHAGRDKAESEPHLARGGAIAGEFILVKKSDYLLSTLP